MFDAYLLVIREAFFQSLGEIGAQSSIICTPTPEGAGTANPSIFRLSFMGGVTQPSSFRMRFTMA
jgi:hypothetical protein